MVYSFRTLIQEVITELMKAVEIKFEYRRCL